MSFKWENNYDPLSLLPESSSKALPGTVPAFLLAHMRAFAELKRRVIDGEVHRRSGRLLYLEGDPHHSPITGARRDPDGLAGLRGDAEHSSHLRTHPEDNESPIEMDSCSCLAVFAFVGSGSDGCGSYSLGSGFFSPRNMVRKGIADRARAFSLQKRDKGATAYLDLRYYIGLPEDLGDSDMDALLASRVNFDPSVLLDFVFAQVPFKTPEENPVVLRCACSEHNLGMEST